MATTLASELAPAPVTHAPWARLRALAQEVAPAVLGYAATRVVTILVFWAMGSRIGVNPWSRLGRADGRHFLLIAEHGWDANPVALPDGGTVDRGYAFFPGFPLVVRAVVALTPLRGYAAGLLVSAVAGCVAAALIYLVGREVLDRRAAVLLPVLWGAQPISIVLSMPYSEPLFTAFAAGCLLALLRRHWLAAGLLCALAGATRATGLALVATLGVAALLAALRRQDGWRPYAAAALAPLGVLGYFAFVARATGRPDGWFWVQEQVFRAGFDGGLYQARAIVKTLTSQQPFVPTSATLILGVLVVGLVLLVQLRPPLSLLVYTVTVVAMALGQSGFHHTKPRLLLTAFPLLAGFAVLLARAPARVLAVVLPLLVLVSAWYGSYVLLLWRWSP